MYRSKKRILKISVTVLIVLVLACGAMLAYINSPLHPSGIKDKTVIEKGEEYTVKLIGVSEYDSEGFMPVTDSFYYTYNKSYLYIDEDGFARTTYDEGENKNRLYGEYNSAFVSYDEFDFCGKVYKNREELESFFKEPDPIYNFDINKLSYYISDIIHYERKFNGRATIKVYRGRCVITEVFIGEEKVLERKGA